MAKNILIESLVDEMAEEMSKETVKVLTQVGKPKQMVRPLMLKFLNFYIRSMIMTALNEYKVKKIKDSEAYEYTRQNFLDLKINLQKEIGTAFEDAFKLYSGRAEVEYYCVINPVPEPISKSLN